MRLTDILGSGAVLTESDIARNPKLVKDIQHHLNQAGYSLEMDGIFGKHTDAAITEFCRGAHLNCPETGRYGASFAEALLAAEKPQLPIMTGNTRKGRILAIQHECDRQGLSLPAQKAYVLATAEHETANTFEPVREAYYLGDRAEDYRKTLWYYPYYGRGLVQLTHDYNYRKYANKLGIDLTANPDRALEDNISLFILVDGMKHGIFTGWALSDFINADRVDFIRARKVINGSDRADVIAQTAKRWQQRLH